jgi:hypothetical protein
LNTGTLINSPVYNSDFGGNFIFNGSNTYINVSSSPSTDLKNTATLTAWVRSTTNNTFKWILQYGRHNPATDRAIVIWNDNRAAMYTYGSGSGTTDNAYSSTIITDGKWHHIVGVVETTGTKIYVDGQLEGTSTPSLSTSYVPADVKIGINESGLTYPFAGNLGAVSMYNRALPLEEIQKIYNEESARYNRTPVKDLLTLGSTPRRAATSPAALRAAGITTDGSYWIQPLGQEPYLTYVRFNYLDGSDWMLLLKVNNTNDMPSGSAFWTNARLKNHLDMNLTSTEWSKYGIWNTYRFNRIAMDMGGRVFPIMIFNTGRTMYNFINGNSPGTPFAGFPANSTDPQISTTASTSYDAFPMKAGSNVSLQTGNERFVQKYGINCWANNASNSTTDIRGLQSLGRAGAWVGCPLDEGAHLFNNESNSGADSGIGFLHRQ